MRKYKEGTIALGTYAFATFLGVFMVSWFGLGVVEGMIGLFLAVVGFLSGLLRAEKEAPLYAGILVLGADAIYLAVRLPEDKGMLVLVILSVFFGASLGQQLLEARRLPEGGETPARQRK